MRIVAIILLLLAAALYYFTEVNQLHDISLQLIELRTAAPVPLPVIPAALGLLLLFIPKKKPAERKLVPLPKPTVSSETTPSPPEPSPVSLDDDWKSELLERSKTITLPHGSSIRIDPMKSAPFGLRLDRTTPENCRKSIKIFAQFLTDVPTPQRAFIQFIDTRELTLPKHNLVRGIFQQHLKNKDYIITSQLDGVDIRFHQAEECWGEVSNLIKYFQ